MPYLYQVTFRMQDLVSHYGKDKVISELFGDSELDMLSVHIDNLHETFGLTVMNEAKEIMFPVEFKKVG